MRVVWRAADGETFDWDELKAEGNAARHGESFEEAAEAFSDALAWWGRDEWHSGEEDRLVVVGHTAARRLLLVIYTVRGERARIISARQANAREQRRHERGDDD